MSNIIITNTFILTVIIKNKKKLPLIINAKLGGGVVFGMSLFFGLFFW